MMRLYIYIYIREMGEDLSSFKKKKKKKKNLSEEYQITSPIYI
jgi:hypothetical protein